jgi:hypothetical protein
MRVHAHKRVFNSLTFRPLYYLATVLVFGCRQQSEIGKNSQSVNVSTPKSQLASPHTQRFSAPEVGSLGPENRDGSKDQRRARDSVADSSRDLHETPPAEDLDHEIARIRKEYRVVVHVRYDSDNFFPSEWKEAPPSANGSQIDPDQARRITRLIPGILSMYPPELVARNLRDIYLLESMSFYGLPYGGTNSRDGIFITSGTKEHGYHHSCYLVALMHAEFSSILYRNCFFPTEEWSKINDKIWKYFGRGKDLLGRSDLFDQTEELLDQGFVTVYGQASLEEDVNEYVAALIGRRLSLLQAVGRHKRVRQKLEILTRFYEGIQRQTGSNGQFEFLTRLKSTIDPSVQVKFDPDLPCPE